jgi:tetratricopeptide (TPR) repeat protein
MGLFMLQGSARRGYFCKMIRFYVMFACFSAFVSSLGTSPGLVWAAPSPNLTQWGEWETAKNLYDSQRFQETLDALHAKPLDNANYYYNLGTVYYKLTQLGPAIANLEKANRLRLHDSDIKYNLAIAKAVLGQAIGPDKLDPASTPLEQLADQISLDEVRTLLGFLGLLVLVVWIRAYLNTRSIRKIFTTSLGNIGLAVFILTTCIFGLERWSSSSPPAVSIQRHSVRSGPGEHFSELARLEAGSKLRLLPTLTEASSDLSISDPGKAETWQQVRYSHEGIGWVKISSLLVL